MKRQRSGLSLLEVLVTGAVLAIFVAALGPVTVQAARLGRSVDEAAMRSQITALAGELLAFDLSRAGYAGVADEPRDLGGPALEVMLDGGSGGDAFTVRFVDDLTGELPVVRVLTLQAARDSSGGWNLYQQEAGATKQPAVQEVRRIEIAEVVLPDGQLLAASSLPQLAAALELMVEFTWGDAVGMRVEFPVPRLIARSPG